MMAALPGFNPVFQKPGWDVGESEDITQLQDPLWLITLVFAAMKLGESPPCFRAKTDDVTTSHPTHMHP